MMLILFFSALVSAANCEVKNGQVISLVMPSHCVKENPKSETCFGAWEVSQDYCRDKQTAVKFSCEKDQVISKQERCPAGQTCQDSTCK
jgi:hypothetical protein